MLRTIDILPAGGDATGLPSPGNVCSGLQVIKRSTIVRGLQANDILTDAHSRATAIIADAEKHAAQIEAAGFRRGLETGMLTALTPIAAMVSEWDKVKAVLRDDAESALRACVEDLATRDATLVTLVEVICEAHMAKQSDKVRIRVPRGAHMPVLGARCRELNLDAVIEVAEAPDSLSVSWRGHTWTAHLGDVANEAWSSSCHPSIAMQGVDPEVICRDALLDVAHTLGSINR